MLHATYGARGDIDGGSSTSQLSELNTENGNGSEDDDEGNDKFNAAAAAAAAAADDDDDDDDDDETRTPGYGCRVMMMRRSWHLELFFSLDQALGLGGQSVSMVDLFNNKIKF